MWLEEVSQGSLTLSWDGSQPFECQTRVETSQDWQDLPGSTTVVVNCQTLHERPGFLGAGQGTSWFAELTADARWISITRMAQQVSVSGYLKECRRTELFKPMLGLILGATAVPVFHRFRVLLWGL